MITTVSRLWFNATDWINKMGLEVTSKTELLMLVIALENSQDLILNDERAEVWHERSFISLQRRVAEEYAMLEDLDEEILSTIGALLDDPPELQ